MAEPTPAYADRARAGSFGTAAEAYERYRPRYPRALITGLVPHDGAPTVDVGAGTGIASRQLIDAGATVLAVEPDARMAAVATAKGIAVEVATFEDWQPGDRTFDLVVFAQSFHWVRPEQALAKVAAILTDRGRLALMWNRITPTTPTHDELQEVYAPYLDTTARPSVDAEDGTVQTIGDHGFSVEERTVVEELHYSGEDWLNMVFTYSNHPLLEPDSRAELRARLAERIGTAGVTARNEALALVCSTRR